VNRLHVVSPIFAHDQLPVFLAECVGNRLEVSSQPSRTPLVSVAVVVCNVDCFLAEAIESILKQIFTDLSP